MAYTNDQFLALLRLVSNSLQISELTEITSITTNDNYLVLNRGENDAQKLKIPLLRGVLGNYNASTNTPSLSNGIGLAGDSYTVSVAGSRDFGNGFISLIVDDVIWYNGEKWIKFTQSQISDIDGLEDALTQVNIQGALVEVLGKTDLTQFEVGDKFGYWVNDNRYVVGKVVGLPVTLIDDIDDALKITLIYDNETLTSDLDSKVSFKVVQNLSETDTQIALKNLSIIRTKTPTTRGSFRLKSDFDFTFPTGEGEIDYTDSDLEIIHDFDFGGATKTLPQNVEITNNGGLLKNGTLALNNTYINSGLNQIFDLDLDFTGTTKNTVWHPEWFGAKFDGTTDDILAINKCIEVVSSLGGGAVLFPTKDCIISDSIILKNNVKLIGSYTSKGWIAFDYALASGNFIKLQNGVNVPMIVIENDAFNWGIHNLKLNGNRPNQTSEFAIGIYDIEETYAGDITGCLVMNTKGYALYKLFGATTTLELNSFEGGVCMQDTSDCVLSNNSIFLDSTNTVLNKPAIWLGDLFFKNQVINNFIWNGTNEDDIFSKTISSISGEIITFATDHKMFNSMPLQFRTTGNLPEPLNSLAHNGLADTYFVTVVSATTIKLSRTALNFKSNTYVSFTDSGIGTQSLTYGMECVFLMNGRYTQNNQFSTNRIEDGSHNATILNGIHKNNFSLLYSGKSNRDNFLVSNGISLINSANNNNFSTCTFGRDSIAGSQNNDKIGLFIDATSFKNDFANTTSTSNLSLNIKDEFNGDFENRNTYGVKELDNAGVDINYSLGAANNSILTARLTSSITNIAVATNTDIVFDEILEDNSNSYNNVTGVFTSKQKGICEVNLSLYFQSVDATATNILLFIKIGSKLYRYYKPMISQTVDCYASGLIDVDDEVKVIFYQTGGNTTPTIFGDNSISNFSQLSIKISN